jgi:hypothetical protein
MSPFVADLRSYVARAKSLPLNQDKAEVRIYAALLTGVAGYFLVAEPIFVLLTVPQSPLHRVASLAPSIWCVVIAFIVCLACMTPHLIALLFRPSSLSARWPRSVAAKAAFGAAVIWIYLANLSLPMDLGAVEWAYGLRALGALMLSFSYGYSVNAQLGREILHAKND